MDVEYLKAIWTPRAYLTVLAVLLAAFIPEIGYTTFSHDYFFTSYLAYNAYGADGRYLSEIIRFLTFGFLPPTLLLMLGLACMTACGVLFCRLLNVTHWFPLAVTCSLFATFPMMFELWSYAATRFTVPFAALLAMLALTVQNPVLGAILICAALSTYQSAAYLAAVAACYVTAYRLTKGELAFRSFAIPRAIIVLAGLALYLVLYLVCTSIFQIQGRRLASFVHVAASPNDFASVATVLLAATVELLAKGVFLFPLLAKLLFLAITAILIGALAMKRSIIAVLLVCAAPLCVFGAAWVTMPPNQMLVDRILFSFVGVYAGAFLTAWLLTHGVLRAIVGGLGAMIVMIFIVQANNWHQFMDLRDRADMDMTQAIATRIRDLPDYRTGMAITLVGTTQDANYLPYRYFDTSRNLVGNTMLASTYSYEDFKTRDLMFFFPLSNFPKMAVVQSATKASSDMPVWPAPGSIAIRENMVIVKLSGDSNG